MTPLDQLYLDHMRRSVSLLKLAVDSADAGWIRAETELMHNIPSLIQEENLHRHRYFFDVERCLYAAWVAGQSDYIIELSTLSYSSIWDQIGDVLSREA